MRRVTPETFRGVDDLRWPTRGGAGGQAAFNVRILATSRESLDISRSVRAPTVTYSDLAGHQVISRRKAESHVQSVLNELGFANRKHIAAWMAARQAQG